MTPDADVLVIGAGPSGLVLAWQLARFGVRARIIDKSEGPSRTSKALGIQARTLELLEYSGAADAFVAAGHKVHGLDVFSGGKHIINLGFDTIESRYNYVLILPQSETERLLTEALRASGGEVEWRTELRELSQAENGVAAVVTRGNGTTETMRAQYAIGCDGPHSAVRHLLGMPFEGSQFQQSFSLADVKMEAALTPDRIRVFLCGSRLTALFPQGNGVWRVVLECHDENPQAGDPDAAEVQSAVDACGPLQARITGMIWASRFRIHQRHVKHYRKGRVFLAGDAAHIHSPLGGQGMNTGIQDACNLSWKIALAVKGVAAEALLDSYETERLPIGADLLRATGVLSRIALSQATMIDAVRDRVAPVLLGWEPVQERILNALSEIAVGYKSSPIVANSGRRAPDALVRREGAQLRLYEAMRDSRHKLIYSGPRPAPAALRDPLQEREPFIEMLSATEDFNAVYGIAGETAIAVRPDGYIGYRGAPEAAALRGYFSRLFRTASSVRRTTQA
jgi:2-polyprenyl-6-methoxyphenol hydroxylase-like FAD-dependent oxidoreductase